MTPSLRLFVGLVLFALAGCTPPPQTEPIIIGHLAPGSGPQRQAGERAQHGINLAIHKTTGDGKSPSGRRIEVHHADARAGENAAADETVRLITITRAVALLGGLGPAHADAIARAAQPYGVPLVTPSPLPGPPAEVAFSTSVSPTYQGQRLAEFAAEEQKWKQVVVLADGREPIASAVAASFVRTFRRDAAQQADTWALEADTALGDFAARLAKTKPGALLFAGSPRDLVRLRGALAEKSVNLPIVYGSSAADWVELLANGDAAQGVIALTTFVLDDSLPDVKAFAEEYRKEFKEEPDLTAASAYEGARILFEAMRRAHSTRPERVREALAGSEPFDTLTGPLTFDREEHLAMRPVFVVTREGAATKLLKRYDPPGK
jgi:branched-chain amino acid transport system substrate-binding protein